MGLLDNVSLHLVETLDDALACREWASRQPDLSVDTEGTNYLPERAFTRLIQFGNLEEGWSIPVELRGWGALSKEILEAHEGTFTAHNLVFDKAMIRQDLGFELPLHRSHDTMIMTHTLSPHKRAALKPTASRLVDADAAAASEQLEEDFKKYGWDWATVPATWPAYWAYGALDTVLTAHLRNLLLPEIQSTCPGAYDLEMATAAITEQMSRRGAHVDRERISTEIANMEIRRGGVATRIRREYGIEPGSGDAIISILQRDGVNFTKLTQGGSISLDKDVLEAISHPLAGLILEYRAVQKMGSTYLQNFYDLTSDEDPFLHPSINSIGFSEHGSGYGVKTSRMSISNPSLQNLPKPKGNSPLDDIFRVIRRCIIARPEHRLVFCDFSQIEMRTLAHYSEDPALIAAFSHGDFFINLARQIYSDPSIQLGDPRRNPLKTLGYGEIYGAGLERSAKALKMTTSEAQAFKNLWNGQYPGIRQHANKVRSIAFENRSRTGDAFIRSEFTNRPYYVPDGKEYALVNRKLQGAAAEIFKLKLIQLDAAGLTPYMILPVHDEIILDVPEEDVRDVCHTLHTIMNDSTILRVPITAEISTGPSWGEKTTWIP